MRVEEKFLSAYDDCAAAILRHVYFRVSDKKLAEDMTQETFMKTWSYLADGNDVQNLKAFIYKVADNLIIDHYRRKGKSDLPLEEAEEMNLVAKERAEEAAELTLSKSRLGKKLAELDDEQRKIILLRYVDGLSAK